MRLILFFTLSLALTAADRAVDPTFLFERLPDVAFAPSDETSAGCRYRPVFGAGALETPVLGSVARFGELEVAPGGRCNVVKYATEEQIYYVLAGKGEAIYREGIFPVRQGDFMYFAPGADHGASNNSGETLRIAVMGFKTPQDLEHGIAVKLPIAHESEAKLQVVGNHPPTTQYRLLLGDVRSQRDLLASAHTVTSLFIMEFAPGGTNQPHHHASDEEIYLVLDGSGEIVAGGGIDGVEGRHPAKAWDAYFYRKNATVGFYASPQAGSKARILAVRSRYADR
jgi:mannose-6-phosphate isomerase-like protein (cupin superfamily)